MDKNSANKGLFFLAVVPPEPLREEIMQMKRDFHESYGSKAALRSPPHITLHMPFNMSAKKVALLEQRLKSAIGVNKSFQISLRNFGAFPPKVIFIWVEENPHLITLHYSIKGIMRGEFNIHNQDYKEQAFHPHITIAFRDLKKAQFAEAWPVFEAMEFKSEFVCGGVCILEHNGKFWVIRSEIPFSN